MGKNLQTQLPIIQSHTAIDGHARYGITVESSGRCGTSSSSNLFALSYTSTGTIEYVYTKKFVACECGVTIAWKTSWSFLCANPNNHYGL